MDIKLFATNYLNPYYLFFRAVCLMSAGGMLLAFPVFVTKADKGEVIAIFAITLTIAIALITVLKKHPFLLYLILPFVSVVTAMVMRDGNPPQDGTLWLPVIIWYPSVFILFWNGVRPWQRGMSLNEINNKLDEWRK